MIKLRLFRLGAGNLFSIVGCCLILAMAGGEVSAQKNTSRKLVVMPLLGAGALSSSAAIMRSIHLAAGALETHVVMANENTLLELENAKELGVECVDNDIPCLIRLGILMQVDELLVPSVEIEDTQPVLRLKRIQVENASEQLSVDSVIPQDEELQADMVRGLVRSILNPERFAGSLSVSSNVNGAHIFLDEIHQTISPHQKPLFPIPEGTHQLRVKHPGYVTWQEEVVVLSGEHQTVQAELVPETVASSINGGSSGTVEGSNHPGFSAMGSAGIAVLGIGGVGALGSLFTVLALDATLVYTEMGDYETRTQLLGAEKTMATVGVLSALVFVGGGIVTAIGLVE
jgi:hypothetical protein